MGKRNESSILFLHRDDSTQPDSVADIWYNQINTMDMSKLIRTEEEYDSFCEDVRNRQYELNPVMVDVSNVWNVETYNWDKEYLEVIRMDNTDTVYLKQYVKET